VSLEDAESMTEEELQDMILTGEFVTCPE